MRSTECRFSFFVLSVPYRLAAAPRDQTYEEALKEMMERIKSGRALKSTANEVRLYACLYAHVCMCPTHMFCPCTGSVFVFTCAP